MQAFDLVDYILYIYAVFSIIKNLFTITWDTYGVTPLASWLSPESQILFVNLVLVGFIFVVYARNYMVMHGIDSRNFRNSDKLCLINLNTGGFDVLERLFRFLIVFVVIASAKKIFWFLTEGFNLLRDGVVNIIQLSSHSKLTPHAENFSYYAIILLVLFILFVIYDLIIIFSYKKKTGDQWNISLKEVNDSGNELSTFIQSDIFILSFFRYLNYCREKSNSMLFNEEYLSENYSDLIHNKKWLTLYWNSPKFRERFFGILSSITLIGLIVKNYPIALAIIFTICFLCYLANLNKNEHIWRTIILEFPFVFFKYFSQIRVSTAGYSHTNKYQYEYKDLFTIESLYEVITMNIKKASGWLLGITALVGGTVYLTQEYIAYEANKKQTLIVWQTEVDKNAVAVLEKVEAEFEKRNPEVDLKIESVSWGGLSKKLNSAIKSNTLPDVSHIQPFMAYSLISKKLLSPITDFVNILDQKEGGILPAVKDLQKFDGEYYGIAYAVGTTFWATRADKLPMSTNLSEIKSWADYLDLLQQVAKNEKGASVILPGGSSFFIDQLYSELLANAGGILFDPTTKQPLLTSPENQSVLQFFRDISKTGALDSSWPTQTYLDQFKSIATGTAFSVPVTYARASRTIQEHSVGSNDLSVGPDLFQWLSQPTLSSNIESIATVDCEPYVIFNAAEGRTGRSGKNNKELALEYLEIYYSNEFYTQFTNSVPVHLTPIFKNMAESDSYLNAVGIWKPWHEKTMALLNSKGKTRPILMPDIREEGRKIPFLLEFQASNILSQAVAEAISNPDREILSIAVDAQNKTIQFLNSISY